MSVPVLLASQGLPPTPYASASEEFHNGTFIAIFVTIAVVFLLLIVGLCIYAFERRENAKLSPKDPGYHAWMHGKTGTFVEILIIVGGVALCIILIGLVILLVTFIGPKLVMAQRADDERHVFTVAEGNVAKNIARRTRMAQAPMPYSATESAPTKMMSI